MATLKEIFGDATRGDGRKFTRDAESKWFFEPIFRSHGCWHGLDDKGEHDYWAYDGAEWIEWHPPKKTKKIKLYSPLFNSSDAPGMIKAMSSPHWAQDKRMFSGISEIVGYQEIEVEVDDV